jgi:repressor LexA
MPKLPPLTARQQAVLLFVAERIQKRKPPPTIREICKRFGFRSPNAAVNHLLPLERKGYITRDAGDSRLFRTLRLTPAGRRHALGIPVVELSEVDEG